MKKFLTAIVFAFTFAMFFTPAKAMFTPGGESYDIYFSGGPNIEITKTTGLTLTKVQSKKYKAFGYFTFDPLTGDVLTKEAITFDGNNPTYIGTFEEGTHVGLWMNPKKNREYSTNDDWWYNRTDLVAFTGNNEPIIGFETGHNWKYDDMMVSIGETDPHAPTGQPLPGILISSLLGLGVAGIVKIRKRP